jgi:hypothetical protein
MLIAARSKVIRAGLPEDVDCEHDTANLSRRQVSNWTLPPGFKFYREEANKRDRLDRQHGPKIKGLTTRNPF